VVEYVSTLQAAKGFLVAGCENFKVFHIPQIHALNDDVLNILNFSFNKDRSALFLLKEYPLDQPDVHHLWSGPENLGVF